MTAKSEKRQGPGANHAPAAQSDVASQRPLLTNNKEIGRAHV